MKVRKGASMHPTVGKPRSDNISSKDTPVPTKFAIMRIEWLASADTVSTAACINVTDLTYDCEVLCPGMLGLYGVIFDGLARLIFMRLLPLSNGETSQDNAAELSLNDHNEVAKIATKNVVINWIFATLLASFKQCMEAT